MRTTTVQIHYPHLYLYLFYYRIILWKAKSCPKTHLLSRQIAFREIMPSTTNNVGDKINGDHQPLPSFAISSFGSATPNLYLVKFNDFRFQHFGFSFVGAPPPLHHLASQPFGYLFASIPLFIRHPRTHTHTRARTVSMGGERITCVRIRRRM